VKVAFDTSVLVAGLHRAHPHHQRAVVWTAEHHGAGALTTFNASDFLRLSLPTSPRIVIPPDPPDVAL
jgi:predicted nucleic acid-binding protein